VKQEGNGVKKSNGETWGMSVFRLERKGKQCIAPEVLKKKKSVLPVRGVG